MSTVPCGVVHLGTTRRAGLRWAAAAAALGLAGLSGCGFALRGSLKFAFSVLRLQGSTATPVARELRTALSSAGVQVQTADTAVPGAAAAGTAAVKPVQVVLTVLSDQRERTVVGQTASGQVRELQLRTRFRFNLATPAGRVLLDNTELLLQRDVSYTETAALAKEAEEALLYRDMQSDIVQQVMRRLAAVRTL
jgi:LPS-assembly lipoprotein